MHNKHLEFSSQLCPISTNAPWFIRNNKRSQRPLRILMHILLESENVDYAANNHNLLCLVEMARNFNQHSNRHFPHYNMFGFMTRFIGQIDKSSIQERIAVMENLRLEIVENRASSSLQRIFNSYHRYDISFKTYHPNQTVYFYQNAINGALVLSSLSIGLR